MVISGRRLADLRRRVPVAAVLAGNHGFEIEGRGFRFGHAGAAVLRPRLAGICANLRHLLPAWPGAWLEDKGVTATVHYRAVAEQQQRSLVLAVGQCAAASGRDFGLRAGKKVLEIHPRVGWSKGQAVNWLRRASGISACLCIGDDRTDESMFRECGGAISVFVGEPRFTSAQYLLRSPAEVRELVCCASEALLDRQASQRPELSDVNIFGVTNQDSFLPETTKS